MNSSAPAPFGPQTAARGAALRRAVTEETLGIVGAPFALAGKLVERAGFDAIYLSGAAFSAGGVKARIDDHLDAGCDVVLVCHVQMVEDALRTMDRRASNTMALAGMLGRGALGWDGLLADARYGEAQARMNDVPVSAIDAGATSGANNVGDVA